jgi:hypothetical protein
LRQGFLGTLLNLSFVPYDRLPRVFPQDHLIVEILQLRALVRLAEDGRDSFWRIRQGLEGIGGSHDC